MKVDRFFFFAQDLKEKAFAFPTFSGVLAVGLYAWHFAVWLNISSVLHLFQVFIRKSYWVFWSILACVERVTCVSVTFVESLLHLWTDPQLVVVNNPSNVQLDPVG